MSNGVPWALGAFERESIWEEQAWIGVAFFAEVFRQYPDKVSTWVRSARSLPREARRNIYLAVWRAEVPAGPAILAAA